MKTSSKQKTKKPVIAVVGLGYVGLPLAVEFGKASYQVIGFDKSERKIDELQRGIESMDEVEIKALKKAQLDLTCDPTRLKEADVIIIAVPTPVNKATIPDMSILHAATKVVGQQMKKGAVVTFESTVYPGTTEEECVPILEQESGLKFGRDFSVGYSPERVNPGDKEHTIPKIIKVVSASDQRTLKLISQLYGSIVKAGIHEAPNIKTAEAAKVIENCQRDLNIALINELSLICERLGIKTMDVVDAATTKWNIHRYTPGLVGGHCIGVDPYYLVYKAQQLGIHPQVLTAGRRINDSMPSHVARMTIKAMVDAQKMVKGAKVLVMGLTFKENCKDTRNAKIALTVEELLDYGIEVIGHDPLIEAEDVHEYPPITFYRELPPGLEVEAIILASGHQEFEQIKPADIARLHGQGLPVVIDVRNFFAPSIVGVDGIYRSL